MILLKQRHQGVYLILPHWHSIPVEIICGGIYVFLELSRSGIQRGNNT